MCTQIFKLTLFHFIFSKIHLNIKSLKIRLIMSNKCSISLLIWKISLLKYYGKNYGDIKEISADPNMNSFFLLKMSQ